MLVAQPCPALWESMDYSPPGSSVHRISQARILGYMGIPRHLLLQGIFPTQGLNLCLLHWRAYLPSLSCLWPNQWLSFHSVFTMVFSLWSTSSKAQWQRNSWELQDMLSEADHGTECQSSSFVPLRWPPWSPGLLRNPVFWVYLVVWVCHQNYRLWKFRD